MLPADGKVLSPHAFRRELSRQRQEKTGYGCGYSAAATGVLSSAWPSDGNGTSAVDARSEAGAYEAFLRNCRALSLKANTALARSAVSIRQGEVVDLSDNYIGAAGLQAMTPLLAENPRLRVLRIPNNGLDNDAVVFLCRALKDQPHAAMSSLTSMDLSGNAGVSLVGGLALLSLAQTSGSQLVELNLAGTEIPVSLLGKISKTLGAKRGTTDTVAASAATAAVIEPRTPAVAQEEKDKTDTKAGELQQTESFVEAWRAQDADRIQALRDYLTSPAALDAAQADGAGATMTGVELTVPENVWNGWRVIDVPILAPYGLFDSEVAVLMTSVFPRLNTELRSRRVVLVPLVHDGRGVLFSEAHRSRERRAPHRDATTATAPELRSLHFTVAVDILNDVRRARLVTIELLGDRPGSYTQPPASALVRRVDETSTGLDKDGGTMEKGPHDETVPLAPALHPVMYTAHTTAQQVSRWVLLASRMPTRRIPGLPPSLAPVLSAEPAVEHPDGHRAVVKRVGITGSLICDGSAAAPWGPDSDRAHVGEEAPPRFHPSALAERLRVTPEVQQAQWEQHQAFRAAALTTVSTPGLVVESYPVTYEGVDERGHIELGQLQAFAEAIYHRLHLLVTSAFPTAASALTREEEGGTSPTHARTNAELDLRRRASMLHETHTVLDAVAHHARTCAMLKKALSNRVHVYVATPPSRNSLLLHGRDRGPLTAALTSAASRLLSMPHVYVVAFHSCHTMLLPCEEPTDVRGMILSVMNQLTTNPSVRQYVASEVDPSRLQRFFVDFLAGAPRGRGTAAESNAEASTLFWSDTPAITATDLAALEGSTDRTNSVSVVFIDGVDAIAPTSEPCKALRCSDVTGVDEWAVLTQSSATGASRDGGKSAGAANVTQAATGLSEARSSSGMLFFPRALARNVRLVASCNSQSESVLQQLSSRGRDSTEVLEVSAGSVNDIEQLLSPAALAAVGVVLDTESFAIARTKTDARVPEYCHYLVNFLRLYREEPGFLSLTEYVEQLPETILGMTRLVYDQLTAAFPVPVVARALSLLRAARWGLPLAVLRRLMQHQLSAQGLQRLLRLLHPALSPTRADYVGTEDGNTLDQCISISSPAFLAFLAQRDLSMADPNGPQDDNAAWHRVLAHQYLSIVHAALHPASAAPKSDPEAPALLRFAVKELTHHVAEGSMWTQLDTVALSVPFLELVYQHGVGYAYLRDMISAFNKRHELFVLGEDVLSVPLGANAWDARVERTATEKNTGSPRPRLPHTLARHRDYVFFARAYGRKLMVFPDLVVQMALERATPVTGSYVRQDAQAHVMARLQRPVTTSRMSTYLAITNTGRGAPIHRGPVSTSCAVMTRGGAPMFITASTDRTLCWLDARAGGATSYYARQPTARIERLLSTQTGAYVAALAEDRTFYVCDANNGALVSRNDGAVFRAPVTDVAFSASGRYYFVATADLTVRVFDSERGAEHFSLGPVDILGEENKDGRGGSTETGRMPMDRSGRQTIRVVPHPLDDEVFLVMVSGSVSTWAILGAGETSTVPSARTPQRLSFSRLFEVGARQEDLTAGAVAPSALTPVKAVWLPLQADSGKPIRREDLGCERVTQVMRSGEKESKSSQEYNHYHWVCPYLLLHVHIAAEASPLQERVMLCDLNRGTTPVVTYAPPQTQNVATGESATEGRVPPVQHCTVSTDGAWLAVTQFDGRIAVYITAPPAQTAPHTVPPDAHPVALLRGFAPGPNSQHGGARADVLGVVFHYSPDAASTPSPVGIPIPAVFAVANAKEVAYWQVPLGLSEQATDEGVRECAPSGMCVLEAEATCIAGARGNALQHHPLAAQSTKAGEGPGTSATAKENLARPTVAADVLVGDQRGCVVMIGFWEPAGE